MRLLKNKFILNFIIYILFVPSYLTHFEAGNQIFKILTITCFIGVLSIYFLKGKVSYFLITVAIFYFTRVMITILHGGYLTVILGTGIPILTICMLSDLMIKEDARKFLSSINFILSLNIYINLLTIILFPNGLYRDGTIESVFLGNTNALARTIIPAFGISLLYSKLYSKKTNKNTIILGLVILLTTILTPSTTLTIAVILTFAFVLLFYKKSISILINFKLLVSLYFIIFISLTVFDFQNLFSFFIVDILGKSLTLSSRTLVWELAYSLIKESPFIGYGGVLGGRYIHLGNSSLTAHNFIIQLLLESGIVGLIAFIMTFIIPAKNLRKYHLTHEAKIISFFIFATLFIYLSEAHYNLILLYLTISMAANLRFLIQNKDKELSGGKIK